MSVKFYTAEEIINLDIDDTSPLITGLLYEKDAMIVMGRAGKGKSTFVQQMCFALSSGESLLHEFETRKCQVLFVQSEGKKQETKKRYAAMATGAELCPNSFRLHYVSKLPLNIPGQYNTFVNDISYNMSHGMAKPDVIVFDPLYCCVKGKLTDDEVASDLISAFRAIQELYDCAIICVHHEKRPVRDDKKQEVELGEEAIFGSYVLQAWPDTIYGFKGIQGGGRKLINFKDRNSQCLEELELTYIEESRMYMMKEQAKSPYVRKVEKIIRESCNGISVQNITEKLGDDLSIHTVRKAIMELKNMGYIEKIGTSYPALWKPKEED